MTTRWAYLFDRGAGRILLAISVSVTIEAHPGFGFLIVTVNPLNGSFPRRDRPNPLSSWMHSG